MFAAKNISARSYVCHIRLQGLQAGFKITLKAPAKRSPNVSATYRDIVGRNMLRALFCAFGRPVAPCCDMLRVVGSSLKIVKFEGTTPNMLQQFGQTLATCCAQQCCDMLR